MSLPRRGAAGDTDATPLKLPPFDVAGEPFWTAIPEKIKEMKADEDQAWNQDITTYANELSKKLKERALGKRSPMQAARNYVDLVSGAMQETVQVPWLVHSNAGTGEKAKGSSKSRIPNFPNFLGLVLGCIEAKFCK